MGRRKRVRKKVEFAAAVLLCCVGRRPTDPLHRPPRGLFSGSLARGCWPRPREGQRYYVYVHHQYKCVFGNCDPNAMRSVGQSVSRSVDLSSFASFQTAAASLHTRCTCTRSANSRGRSGDRSLQKTRFHGGRRSVVVLSPLFVLTFALTV